MAIKKESPNEGTETRQSYDQTHGVQFHKKRIPEWGDGNMEQSTLSFFILTNKKRIPEWGDGNNSYISYPWSTLSNIKKESPNEGTETLQSFGWGAKLSRINKKRIPEWGGGKNDDGVISMFQYADCIWLLYFFLLTIIRKEESGK